MGNGVLDALGEVLEGGKETVESLRSEGRIVAELWLQYVAMPCSYLSLRKCGAEAAEAQSLFISSAAISGYQVSAEFSFELCEASRIG